MHFTIILTMYILYTTLKNIFSKYKTGKIKKFDFGDIKMKTSVHPRDIIRRIEIVGR